jgi:hypothetical protein
MYGYSYVLVSRGLYNQPSSPYGFEPGEPDDIEADTGTKERGTLALLAAYLLVVAVVAAALWLSGDGESGVTEQARRGTPCVHAPGLWSGCLPTR